MSWDMHLGKALEGAEEVTEKTKHLSFKDDDPTSISKLTIKRKVRLRQEDPWHLMTSWYASLVKFQASKGPCL